MVALRVALLGGGCMHACMPRQLCARRGDAAQAPARPVCSCRHPAYTTCSAGLPLLLSSRAMHVT